MNKYPCLFSLILNAVTFLSLSEYEHSSCPRDGSFQPSHDRCAILPSQHPKSHQRSSRHVLRARGSRRLNAEREDTWPLEKEILPLTETSWLLCKRSIDTAQVFVRLVRCWSTNYILDLGILFHTSFPHWYVG